jgi:superfamily II RNA helicase
LVDHVFTSLEEEIKVEDLKVDADLKITWSFILGTLINPDSRDSSCDDCDRDSFTINSFLEKCGLEKTLIDDVLNNIKTLSTVLEKCKTDNRLKNMDLELNYKFGCCVYLWTHGFVFSDIVSQNICDLFEGNFVKNILKIHNICEELKQACQILGRPHYILLFDEIQSKLIKDIVVIDSLYITT